MFDMQLSNVCLGSEMDIELPQVESDSRVRYVAVELAEDTHQSLAGCNGSKVGVQSVDVLRRTDHQRSSGVREGDAAFTTEVQRIHESCQLVWWHSDSVQRYLPV